MEDNKDKCWYKSICNHSKCGEDTFCMRHYKMCQLADLACLEGNQRYTIKLLLDSDGADREAYSKLSEIKNNMVDFVTSGKNLIIWSERTGNGKTEWAKKLIFSWFDAIWPSTDVECRGLFISLPKLMASLKNNISESNSYFKYVNEHILTADLVIWDELNYKDLTQFEHDYMFNVIDQRMSTGKSNIFTTNYPLEETVNKLGTRLGSRILGKSIKIELRGKDKRGLGVK